jgi:hypothetical protein
MTPRQRYNDAHYKYQCIHYPAVIKDGHYTPPVYPKTSTANGLTKFCLNFITWSGYYANRINTMGRLIDAPEKQESGIVLTGKKWMHSTTKRGTADLHCIIKGRHVSIEIKIGTDRMSDHQKDEQARITAAGGTYIVVKTAEDFLDWYDNFTKL